MTADEERVAEKTTTFTPFVSQVCKGLAALMLLTHHLFYNYNPSLYPESLHLFAHKCKFCVAMFLMLSGAGITLSGCTWRKIYIYRIPKMLLNYWLVGLIFIPIGMKFFGMTFEAAYPDGTGWIFWLQLFGVNWVNSCGGFNPTWWFMDAIIPLYCVAPAVYMLMKWNPLVIILVASFATIFPWDFHWWMTPFIFGMASVGMNSFECLAGKKNAMIGLVVCSIFFGFSYCYHTEIPQHFILAFFLISIICSLCVIVGNVSKFIFSPLAFIGRHSMNIFLLHTFLLIWYGRFFAMKKPFVTYPILLGVSLISSIVIENIKKLIYFHKFIGFLKRIAT